MLKCFLFDLYTGITWGLAVYGKIYDVLNTGFPIKLKKKAFHMCGSPIFTCGKGSFVF